MIKTDILIIGAGPTGLFTVFEAGLLGLRCHIIDTLAKPGGQCVEIYPKKPIFDIPAIPEIQAGKLIDNLLEQIKPFKPGYTLSESAEKLEKLNDGSFNVITNKGTVHNSKVIAIAGGLGSFEPRKPLIEDISKYEGKGVEYIIKDPKVFKNKNVFISGGGDSALDWSIELQKFAKKITLVHRRKEFRGAYDSVMKVQNLKEKNLIDIITPAEVIGIKGDSHVESLIIKSHTFEKKVDADYFIPLFGLTPKLGRLQEWGLKIEKNSICVDNSIDYQTNIPGIFAIGDINIYPGKLKLILCGFHEATLMCQAAFKIINPNKKNILKYTTVTGINGFDGSKKKSESPIVKSL